MTRMPKYAKTLYIFGSAVYRCPHCGLSNVGHWQGKLWHCASCCHVWEPA